MKFTTCLSVLEYLYCKNLWMSTKARRQCRWLWSDFRRSSATWLQYTKYEKLTCVRRERNLVLKVRGQGQIRLLLEPKSTLFLHGVCMLRECIYSECAHEQHVRKTLTLNLTHTNDTITAYWVSGNVRVRILICATRQKPCRKRIYLEPTIHYRANSNCIRSGQCFNV